MKTAVPTRIVILILALVGGAAALLAARTTLFSSSDGEDAAVAPIVRQDPSNATPAPADDRTAATTAKIRLLPGLPDQVANRLRFSRVVVVSLYAGVSPSDRAAVASARAAVRNVGAGFVALNVFDDRLAKQLEPFAGTTSVPALLVVRRPGNIVKRFEGFVDPALAAQAARNAGARRR